MAEPQWDAAAWSPTFPPPRRYVAVLGARWTRTGSQARQLRSQVVAVRRYHRTRCIVALAGLQQPFPRAGLATPAGWVRQGVVAMLVERTRPTHVD